MNLSKTSINRLASCVLVMLVGIGLLSAGCQQSSDSIPAGLQSVPQHFLHQVGKVHFVSDPTTGFRLATEKNLPCLLFFTAEWCTYCHDMQETAFTNAAVGDLAQGFVCVEIDGNRHEDILPTLSSERLSYSAVRCSRWPCTAPTRRPSDRR